MKVFLLLLFLYGTFFPTASQEQTGMGSNPSWFVVFEEKGTGGTSASFMRAQKKAIDLWKSFYPEVPVFAWQNEDNSLYRTIPIHRFASIDTLHRRMTRMTNIMKARSRYSAEFTGNPSTISTLVMVWVPELSHHPEVAFSPNPAKPYTKWMFLYLLSDQEEAAVQALHDFRDYYIDNKLDYPWDTFRVLLGNNTPVMINLFQAESPAALQAKGTKIWEKHAEELEYLWEQVERYSWKMMNKTGWFSPSLSNVPVSKPKLPSLVTDD